MHETLGFVHAGGRRLECCTWGGGRTPGPLLVLLHEGLGSLSMWKHFPARLAACAGCDVFAYSRAGNGWSDPASLPRTPGYMHPEALEILPEVLASLDAVEIVLVGHSDGASIALLHAGGGIDRRIRAMVVMAPHAFVEPMCVEQIARARDAYETGDLRGRLSKYHADVDHTFYGWNDIWLHPAFRAWNIEDYLPHVHVPVLVMQGEGDEYGTLAQVRSVVEKVAGPVESCILQDCRHAVHLDQPEHTLEAVTRLIRCLD
jgi:pimeloyl-ACP methyl ester carboxylesterase